MARKKALFHPIIRRWFADRMGTPTDVQEEAWPRIAAGEHVLVSAPTGTGKTMAAFLWAINQLATGEWASGATRVLYVSPLRALNYDIQRNLLAPLDEIRERFEQSGKPFPQIHVATRSGDTPQAERRRMLRHPPEILITTPESLNLLLSSLGGRSILTDVATVILDEVHGVAGNKRGVHLITAVERLVRLSGEFQRIALSATVRPLERIAEFVGGFELKGPPENPEYRPRPVALVESRAEKKYDLRISDPRESATGEEDGAEFWVPVAEELRKIIRRNRSTLVFVNSRRMSETLTLRINEGEREPLAYAHHGSLSLEVRSEVERRLKAGELRAIVATHSLELGIDIGALDEVVLVQSPFSISSAIQRIGRAGHRVGGVSRGTFFPTHPKDFLEAAVLVPAVLNGDIEEVRPVLGALDVLAQVITSTTAVETWKIDSLFAAVRASYPYRHLSRRQFDLVLEMLAGRYAYTRIRELKPRVSIDSLDGTVSARRGALQALYASGGTIPDRGYFRLRHRESGARIGELDEEFVWEAKTGDVFALGTQNWRIREITHNEVLVDPAPSAELATPFWRAEENGREFRFSEKIGIFLQEADGRLEDSSFPRYLRESCRMKPAAADRLLDFLKTQRAETGTALPHRNHVVVESVSSGPGGSAGYMTVIHTLWGGRVNRPLALALESAWKHRFGHRLELYVGNDSIVLLLPQSVRPEDILSMATSDQVETLLRESLEGSGFFGARFRECAGRALLLAKSRWGERMPLWLSRLQSQKLLDAVLEWEDFPILLETWRTCLREEFDLESLKKVLGELESGVTRWTHIHTPRPSPFARTDWWRQVNEYMYMNDELRSTRSSKLRRDLLREVALEPGLRPTVSRDMAERFEARRQRLIPGYSPQNVRELVDWLQERLMIPVSEWDRLLEAIRRDHGEDPETWAGALAERTVRLNPASAADPLILARENAGHVIAALYGRGGTGVFEPGLFPEAPGPQSSGADGDLSLIVGQWLQYYGPKTAGWVRAALGLDESRVQAVLDDLEDADKIVRGRLVTGGETDEVCDAENFEALLRISRAEARPSLRPLPIETLPLFLAHYQGITRPLDSLEGLEARIEQLLCYPAEAGMWEEEIFPARLQPYDPSWLDTVMQEGEIEWIGAEGHRVAFCFESDLDLFREESPNEEEDAPAPGNPFAGIFPDPTGHYDFSALVRHARLDPASLADRLWSGVWEGQVTSDAFLPVRRAVLQNFKAAGLPPRERPQRRWSRRRAALTGSKEQRLLAGSWRLVPPPEISGELLESEERKKERARILLDRYGILFRELLQRESPAFSWPGVFRSLRIMELSGEVLGGYFFEGIPGPQFISPQALQALRQGLPENAVYWMNAADPASLSGVPVDALRGKLPPRLPGTHLVFRGTRLVMVSKRNGKDLLFHVPPEDASLPEVLAPLRHLLTRHFQPIRRIAVETINGEPAPGSPYLPSLRSAFEVVVDYKHANLSKK
ncbi:MAG TPA: DEAD/DEAH box helicase, partial [Thermodesulfobacteriota bacterium]|nr:DEAD/DEAH box helicase [Thermodesulfobacteriota bacterium]